MRPLELRYVLSLLALCLVTGISSCGRSATTQEYKGAEITIRGLSRMDSWEGFVAKDGHEFVVIDLGIDTESLDNELQIMAPELVNVDGSAGETPIKRLDFSGGAKHDRQLGFAVPKGTQPRSLKLGDVVFDLTKLENPSGG